MKKSINIAGQTFTAAQLKSQIERQYIAMNGGRWGNDTIQEINDAISQAEEKLSAENGRCPKTATLALAYKILRDGKLIVA